MGAVVSNVLITVIILIILFFAVKNMIPHFKGEGSCCGGGGKAKLIKPKKLDKVVAVKTVHIDGMVCDNCSGRVHNALNSMEGVNAKVNRAKGQAVVKTDREIKDEKLVQVIADLGYKVTDIS